MKSIFYTYIELKHLKVDVENFKNTPRRGRKNKPRLSAHFIIRPLHRIMVTLYYWQIEGYSGIEVKET